MVLPCLNEEASVGLCIQEAMQALANAGLSGEVVVVDNGSSDRSASIATFAGARVVTERRAGYGHALRAGIQAARGTVVIMADADCTYDLSRVGDLARPVLEGDVDMVLGGRLEASTRETMPLLHRFVGTPVLTFLNARACGGLPVRDSQSGYRAFRREDALGLNLRTTGMEFASELLIRGAREGWQIREISIPYRPRIGDSKLRTLQDGWRHLRLIVLLAPDLALIWPGIFLLMLGVGLSAWGLVSGDRLALGSWHWQPVFFASVAIVLGVDSLFAGVIIANRCSALSPTVRRRFRTTEHPRFPKHCTRGGCLVAVIGVALDIALAAAHPAASSPSDRGLVLAGLAQTLIIVGTTIAGFGAISPLLADRRSGIHRGEGAAHHDTVDSPALNVSPLDRTTRLFRS